LKFLSFTKHIEFLTLDFTINLKLPINELENFDGSFNNLRKLTIYGRNRLLITWLAAFIKKSPKLKSLCLDKIVDRQILDESS
jgi:hypothetical protein